MCCARCSLRILSEPAQRLSRAQLTSRPGRQCGWQQTAAQPVRVGCCGNRWLKLTLLLQNSLQKNFDLFKVQHIKVYQPKRDSDACFFQGRAVNKPSFSGVMKARSRPPDPGAYRACEVGTASDLTPAFPKADKRLGLWMLVPSIAHASSFALVLYPSGALTAIFVVSVLYASKRGLPIRFVSAVVATLTTGYIFFLPAAFYDSQLFHWVESWLGEWTFFVLGLIPASLMALLVLEIGRHE